MVYVVLAKGFEEIEAVTAVDVLRRAGFDVKTVGIGGKTLVGSHGIPVLCDIAEEEMREEEMELLVLPGGAEGVENLGNSPIVERLTRLCIEQGRPLAAICAAPSLLGKWGLSKGKLITCYPGFEEYLEDAYVQTVPVICDQTLITARGPGVATEFALTIVSLLKGPEQAQAVREGLQCRVL